MLGEVSEREWVLRGVLRVVSKKLDATTFAPVCLPLVAYRPRVCVHITTISLKSH